jgi:hypothetical protein
MLPLFDSNASTIACKNGIMIIQREEGRLQNSEINQKLRSALSQGECPEKSDIKHQKVILRPNSCWWV